MTSIPPALRAPFFEIGPKNLLRLPEIVEVAAAAARAGRENAVSVIVTVPAPVIAQVQRAVPDVFVFAEQADWGIHGEDLLVARDSETFARHILRLLADPALARHLGAAGRRYVEQHHDWNVIGGQLEVIYRETIAAYGRSR